MFRKDVNKVILEEDVAVGNRSYYPMEILQQEQLLRIQHLQRECQGKQSELFGLSTEKWAYGRIEVSQRHNYMYCPLLKVGSTFFRRLFYAMNLGKKVRSPYDIAIQRALNGKRDVLSKMTSFLSHRFLKTMNPASIMFVREPFSRLLSGYTDKLFAPNPYFWQEIGVHIVTTIRHNYTTPPPKSKKICAHDVTFSEFIKYVIDAERTDSDKRDAHFTPTYDQCKPCSLNYTVIGKMDSFLPDVAYTLEQLGNPVSKETLKIWAKQATADAIDDSTYSPFGWKRGIRKCMTWEQALKRIWRKLQIRGIILFSDTFPWSGNDTSSVTLKHFQNTVKVLHSKSDKNLLKQQKLDVLAEAYSTVSEEDIRSILELFMPDFTLFQYNPKPDFIFDDDNVKRFRGRDFVFNLDSV